MKKNIFLFLGMLLCFDSGAMNDEVIGLANTCTVSNDTLSVCGRDLLILKWSDGKFSAGSIEGIRRLGIGALPKGNRVAVGNRCGFCWVPNSLRLS
jgi:hypothetical protein